MSFFPFNYFLVQLHAPHDVTSTVLRAHGTSQTRPTVSINTELSHAPLLHRRKRSRAYHVFCIFFFFNDTATTEIYTLSLHDALPIAARAPAYVSQHRA